MKISSLLLFFPTAHAVTYPVGITNCGLSSWITEKPSRAITLNQGTTEIMLALGLADSMVGTAYLDDEIWPEVAEDYTKVPILSDTYPTAEQVLELDPDFLYASYSSAFSTKGINYTTVLDVQDCALVVPRNENENRTFCRQELHDQDISTYLQEPFCELVEHRSDEVTMDVLFKEIWDIANIFDVYENGRTLVDSIDYHFDQAIRVSQSVTSDAAPIRVLWLDSWNEETPYVGACCGAVQVILEHAGVENIFADLGVEEKRSWESASWDDVVELDPDLIILVDASWSPAGMLVVHVDATTSFSSYSSLQTKSWPTCAVTKRLVNSVRCRTKPSFPYPLAVALWEFASDPWPTTSPKPWLPWLVGVIFRSSSFRTLV